MIFKSKKLIESIQLGNVTLPVVLSSRRKSIAVKQKNGEVFIEVPKLASKKLVESVISQNQSFFLRQVEHLKNQLDKQFSGAHGERFLLFGEAYRVVWNTELASSNVNASFDLCEQKKTLQIDFGTRLKSDAQKQAYTQKVITNLFTQSAESYLLDKVGYYADLMALEYTSLTVKGYKSRWGSCYSDGRIQFNWRLMQAPRWVIDYVVVHELAHLVHHNHSKAFWHLVEAYYPQTKEAKKYLKIYGTEWITFLQK